MRSRSTQFLFAGLMILAISPIANSAGKSARLFPKGCRAQGFEFTNELLAMVPTNSSDMKQTLYLLNNLSDQTVKLRAHEKQYELLGMDWNLNLESHAWSSFALNKPRLEFTCEIDGVTIDCQKTLQICEYNRAVFGKGILGSYWVVTNKPLQEIVERSIKNGILLRW